MLHVSLIFESVRVYPRLMFWTAALSQAVLWTLLPALFYSAPPGDLPIVLAVGHEFQLGSESGPPLAFWLAELAYRFGSMTGVYLLSQLCIVATLMGIFALGRSIVGSAQAVLAVLMMIGIIVMSVPTPEFGPAILAMPIWTMVLLFFWRAVGDGRSEYWIPLALSIALLLLTTSQGWLLFLLFAIFVLLSSRGRAAFRSIDPWLCLFVAFLIAAPYLAWLAYADDVWKPSIDRLTNINLQASAIREWLTILWNLAVAHVGVVLFVLLAMPWKTPRGVRLPTVDRQPMPPSAKIMIYFFALAPLLVVTAAASLLGQSLTLAKIGPLVVCSSLAVLAFAGDKIPLSRQQMLSFSWIGLLVGPPLGMAFALILFPWVGIDFFRVLYPTSDFGRFFSETFERRTGQPLTIVAGDPEIAALIALDRRTRPSLLMDPPARSRWVSVADARSKGAVVVWPATDTPGTPPAAIKAAFPDLAVEVPRVFERSIQGRLPPLRIGWAVIRPQLVVPPPPAPLQ